MTKLAKSNIDAAALQKQSAQYIVELRQSLTKLINVCEGLSAQQAMDDNFWVEYVKEAKELLKRSDIDTKIPNEVFVEFDEDDGTPVWATANKSDNMDGVKQYRYVLDRSGLSRAKSK